MQLDGNWFSFCAIFSEIVLVISKWTCTVGLFDFEIVQMISDQIVLYSVQLSLFIITLSFHKAELQYLARFWQLKTYWKPK